MLTHYVTSLCVFCFCSPPFSELELWVKLVMSYKLPFILLMPLDTLNRKWYKDIEGIASMQILIAPQNKVLFHKSNGEKGVGGRDKCAFFVYGMNDIIPQSPMLIEDSTGKFIPYPEADNPETSVPTKQLRSSSKLRYIEEEAQEAGADDDDDDDYEVIAERLADDTTVLKTRSGNAYKRFKKAIRSVVDSIPDIVAEQDESIATENTMKAMRSKRSITIITQTGDDVKTVRKITEDSQSYGDVFELANDDKALKGFSNDSQLI